MKKIFTMAVIALFTMTSCSEDDAVPTPPGENPAETVLLRKTISFNPMSGQQEETVYTYDSQNRLISIKDGPTAAGTYYTYLGDIITKTEVKADDGSIINTDTYEYDSSGRLIVCKSHLAVGPQPSTIKDVFTYNQDGTITTTQYSGDENSQPNIGATIVFQLSGGNIIQSVTTAQNSMGGPVTTTTDNYTFDDKYTPTRNIPGMSALMLSDMEGGVNNITSRSSVEYPMFSYTHFYTYNNEGYPVTQALGTQGNITVQYFYE